MLTQVQAKNPAYRSERRAQPRRPDRSTGTYAAMTLKDVIAYCLVISLGLILAIHFALFWIYGGVFIYEDNKTILLLETIMSVAIFGFGIERLLSSVGRQHEHSPSHARTDQRTHYTYDVERAATRIPNDSGGSTRGSSGRDPLRYAPSHIGIGSTARAHSRSQVSIPDEPAGMTALMSTHGAGGGYATRTGEEPFVLSLDPMERR
jgi:hypothetical protein